MGAAGSAQSKSKQSILTKSAVEVLTQNIMNCSSNTFAEQLFEVSGSYNVIKNVKQVQALQLSATCNQENKDTTALQAQISNELIGAASTNTQALLGALGNSKSEVEQNIRNEVSQKITKATISNIVNNVNATQKAIISGDHNIVDTFSQEQTMKLVYDACQTAILDLKAAQAIENSAKSKADNVQTNPISDIVKSVFSGMNVVFLIIAVVFVIGMVFLGPRILGMLDIGKKASDLIKDDDQPQQQQQYIYQPPPQMQPPPQYSYPPQPQMQMQQPMQQPMQYNLQQAGYM